MKRFFTIGIILLFVGMTIAPSTGFINTANIQSDKHLIDEKEIASTSSDDVDWWPMFHHDINHTGYSSSDAPETNNVKWIYTTGDEIWSSPAVVDNKVYFGCLNFKLYCLDADTGVEIWIYTTEGKVNCEPTVANGKVYFGSGDKNIYCLDADNGSKIWNYTTGAQVWSGPAIVDDKIYIGSRDHNLYCLNASTGEKIWNYTTGNWVQSSPTVIDDKVYFGSDDYNVYCLFANNGSKIWHFKANDQVHSSPAVVDGKIYIASRDHNLYCLNASTGEKIWNYTTGDWIFAIPAVFDGKVYIGSKDYKMYCLDAENGSKIWHYKTGWPVYSSPAIADGKVYFGSYDKDIYCLDAYTGEKIWNYTTLAYRIYSSPAIADSKVYIGDVDGILYCFGEPNVPPEITNINGPTSGTAGKDYDYKFNSTDPNGDDVRYFIDWGDTITEWTVYYPSGSEVNLSHSWEKGTYNITAKAQDIYGAEGPEGTLEVTMRSNGPPYIPDISGPRNGTAGTEYEYTFNSTDPDDDPVMYLIDWGDNNTDWTEYCDSGDEIKLKHTWDEQGDYTIKAKAKDIFDAESDWGTLEVTMPKNKAFNFNFNLLSWLLERFPNAFPILCQLLGF